MTDASPTQLPRKFYQQVAVEGFENGWHVQLDGRTPVTPARNQLSMPTEQLAQALAEEWDRQDTVIDLPRMTLTRLANVALDRTPETREELVEEVVKYAGTDLVCYLSDGPSELRERQEAHFRPIRDWAGREHGVMLMTTEGVINAPQPQASLEAMHNYASGKDDFTLTGLAMGLGLYGSAVLAMAPRRMPMISLVSTRCGRTSNGALMTRRRSVSMNRRARLKRSANGLKAWRV